MEGSNLFYALLGGFSFSLERICLQCERPGFDPWVGRISWKRERLPTPIFWPREFHGLVHGAEFQRIARRDKKVVLSDLCKEIEENNRMWKTRDLFKKIRDTKGTFHPKMCTIKDQNSMNLPEAEVLRKGGKNTQTCTKKTLMTQITSITMNKASGGDGIPVELFQILKDDAVKVLHSLCQQIWKNQQWPQTGRVRFHSNSKERMPNIVQTLHSCTYLTH